MVFNIGRSNASKKGKVMADYYDLDLYTRKLCSDAVVRSDKHKEMLTNYYYELTDDEQKRFCKCSEQFWNFVKHGSKKYKITTNAIMIAIRIKQELNISCYPLIEKIAIKGWSTSDGTFSWSIPTLEQGFNNELCSFEPVSMFLKKNMIWSIGQHNTFTVISVDKQIH